MGVPARMQRLSGQSPPGEFRSPFEKDRDRLIWSHAFLRLAGVTQVSSQSPASTHHFRFAHSIKVGLLGAALTRTLIEEYRSVIPGIEDEVDPSVVEAAGLAHDIGHPPGGHNGEVAISEWLEARGAEPFEGNAQTFRVLAETGDRSFGEVGLDLTRATLLASCKYPWGSDSTLRGEKFGKFGFYREDEEIFAWAAEGTQAAKGVPTLEAQLMDWADDITYAIHDAQDYYRSGQLPLHRVLDKDGSDDQSAYVDWVWEQVTAHPHLRAEYASVDRLDQLTGLSRGEPNKDRFVAECARRLRALGDVLLGLTETGEYSGSHQQRGILVGGSAHLLGRLVEGPTEGLDPVPFSVTHEDGVWRLHPDDDLRLTILLLKGLLFWKVVPDLAEEQAKEANRLTDLLNRLWDLLMADDVDPRMRGELAEVARSFSDLDEALRLRYVADLVAGLSDLESAAMHAVLCENEAGADDVGVFRRVPLPPWPFRLDE